MKEKGEQEVIKEKKAKKPCLSTFSQNSDHRPSRRNCKAEGMVLVMGRR